MKSILELLPKRLMESEHAGSILLSAAAIGGLATATVLELVVGAPSEAVNAALYGGGVGIVGNCAASAVVLAAQNRSNTNASSN